MDFVRIFGDDNCMLSVKYDDEILDEFAKIFNQWTDIEYLESFFTDNKEDLARPFWEGITIEQAVLETRKEAIKFRQYLRRISKKPSYERQYILSKFFHSLNKKNLRESFLDKKKAYGKREKTWLRIYALKAGDDMYIITGGAIKLTDNMSQRPHTKQELVKLNLCRQFLLDEGIVDDDGMIEQLEL